jgi:hypothetical protein
MLILGIVILSIITYTFCGGMTYLLFDKTVYPEYHKNDRAVEVMAGVFWPISWMCLLLYYPGNFIVKAGISLAEKLLSPPKPRSEKVRLPKAKAISRSF